AGDDVLSGGSGRNIRIGGIGADTLVGSQGNDILIGGRTVYDSNPAALAALNAILAEWSSGRDYATRVQNIRTGSGPLLSSGFRLQAGVTVFNDADVDDLTGAAGADWFFADLGRDRVRDRNASEWLDPL